MEAHENSKIPQNAQPVLSLRDCLLYNIDRISYTEALALQHDLHDKAAAHEIPGILMLLEHDPVITIGVKASANNNVLVSMDILNKHGVSLVETDRGGDVTYHGPGQLVGYLIVRLREQGGDLHGYLRSLEQCIIGVLDEFGLKGGRNGPAGVWVGDKKVCSIGVAVRKWVTYHGFALNVNPNMSHFHLINPCGLASEQITSMSELLGYIPDMNDVRDACARSFAKNFNRKFIDWNGEPK